MAKMILFELKKIFKSKFKLILCAFVLLGNLWMSHYYNVQYISAVNENKMELHGVEALRYLDQFYSDLKGTVNATYLKDIEMKKTEMLKRFMDHDKSKEVFGEYYPMILEINDKENLDPELVKEIVETTEKTCKQLNIPFPLSYNDDYTYLKIDMLYLTDYKHTRQAFWYFDGPSQVSPFMQILNEEENQKIEYIVVNNQVKIKDTGFADSFWPYEWLEKYPVQVIDYLNDRYENMSSSYDSTVGATTLFNCISNYMIWLLNMLLIIVLLADVFSTEQRHKMDQYLACAKEYKRITVAKITTVLIVTVSIFAIQMGLLYGFVSWIVPIKNLDVQAVIPNCLMPLRRFDLFTFKELLIRTGITVLFALLSVSIVTSVLSCLTQNRIFASIATMLFVALPMVFINNTTPFNMDYFPFEMLRMDILFGDNIRFGFNQLICIGENVYYTASIICVGWVIAGILLYLFCYLKERRHIVRS